MPGPTEPKPECAAAPQRRVRIAMYAAFAAIAALVLFEADVAHRHERLRAADTEIVDLAVSERLIALQLDRAAARAGGVDTALPAQAVLLESTLASARARAAMIEALLGARAAPAGAMAEPVAAWRAANARLWDRGEQLRRQLEAGEGAPRAPAAAALEAEIDPVLQATAHLGEQLQRAADLRSRERFRLFDGGVAATLALLALLALAVVEPTARALRAQWRRLGEQRADLERLALVAAQTDNIVLVIGADHRIEWVNAAFERRTGYAAGEVRGARPGALLRGPRNERSTLRALRAALRRGEGQRAELHCASRDGAGLCIDVDVQPVGGGARGFVAVGTDVTERRLVQEQLRLSSRTDALTGLPNRTVAQERVQRALDHAARHPGYGFAVLFMDFDRFKQVNDTLGHGAGDDLLRLVGQRIVETLRPGDAVARMASQLGTAARLGGDEFVVVLEGVREPADALVIAERLLAALAEPYTVGAHPVQSTVSIGIVTNAHAAADADAVLRDADTAMYEAKRAGRGRCVVFDSSMRERVVRSLEIENDLRRALRENELFVVYQPVLALRDGALAGVEALVRWAHPVLGTVPPARFIGVAEEAGLIDAIGQQVMQIACRQFARWRDELGELAPPRVAINLSRAQLALPGLVPEVRFLLDENAMRPQQLQFEITESLAAQDARVQATLRELKELGVGLALDDFGTGYSSLACLHQLPVDTVKIDRSFVMHAETVEYHRVLIEATIRVAQTLGMTTVAEGIETAGQAALMEKLHCDLVQGYLFGKPMPAPELITWIRSMTSVGA